MRFFIQCILSFCLMTSPVYAGTDMLMGFSLIAHNTVEVDIIADYGIIGAGHFAEVNFLPQHVNWSVYVSDWNVGSADTTWAGTLQVVNLARANGMKIFIGLDVFDGENIETLPTGWTRNFKYAPLRTAFANWCHRVVVELNPDYFVITMEDNEYFVGANSDDWPNYISLVEETIKLLRSLDADVKIGPTVQYEQVTGVAPGYSAHWAVLDEYAIADFIGLTTYPQVGFATFSVIPSNYYSQITSHTSIPIVIGESGWSDSCTTYPTSCTAAQQLSYLTFLMNEAETLNAEVFIWYFTADWEWGGYGEFFANMGLRDENFTTKPTWDAWVTYRASTVLKSATVNAATVY